MRTRTHGGPLYGRTVVVTGAARGLGAAVARSLGARGARVALLGLEGGRLRDVAAASHAEAASWEVDVTDDAAMAEAAQEVRSRFGPVSVVVANAGVARGGLFADTDPYVWRRVVEVNLIGSAVTARSFLPDLLHTRGYYLQVASLASLGATPLMSGYCASKAGVESFAQSLRAELSPRGVAVGIGYLNWIDTDLFRAADHPGVLRELRAHLPPPARAVSSAGQVAERLAVAVERRRPSVYVPAWLRAVPPVRACVPPVVTRHARAWLPRLERDGHIEATGLLGAGGRADELRDSGPGPDPRAGGDAGPAGEAARGMPPAEGAGPSGVESRP
ncbi:SDR family oxidoreductase [Streptomyces sp. NPDC012421]|uniref:SDR family oxidoreductase n=1 Tax=Streptomyces sp. NPDC012421 TaxID=3364832 RepID=UPI0036ED5016